MNDCAGGKSPVGHNYHYSFFQRAKYVLFACLLFSLIPNYLLSQSGKAWFYHGKKFGSESVNNPLSTILNGGYGILQLGDRDQKIFEINYRAGLANVWDNLLHPVYNIRKFGTKKFILSELFPGSLRPESSQYLPNYQNHLIGGGMTYRMMKEWFEFHHYPKSSLFALGSITAYHLLNEIVENDNYSGTNVDPIADFLIFNPLGILLFTSDGVARFLGETLHLRDWSYFPTYDPIHRTIENNGQNFMIKIDFKGSSPWSLFYSFGNHGVFGLSRKLNRRDSFSFAAGAMSRGLRPVEREDGIQVLTAELVWHVGAFYDREHSLLASLLFSGSRAYKARLTIFPGVVKFRKVSPAIFAAISDKNKLIFGISFRMTPVGLAGRF